MRPPLRDAFFFPPRGRSPLLWNNHSMHSGLLESSRHPKEGFHHHWLLENFLFWFVRSSVDVSSLFSLHLSLYMWVCVCCLNDSVTQGHKNGETINSGNFHIKVRHRCTLSINSLQFLQQLIEVYMRLSGCLFVWMDGMKDGCLDG